MKSRMVLHLLPVAAALLLFACGCGGKGFGSYTDAAAQGREKTHFEIYQPHHIYKNDKVLVWHNPSRDKRKFLLDPGTRVKVLKTVDGTKYGQEWDMYLIETMDGRQGWVPSGWCKEVKGR